MKVARTWTLSALVVFVLGMGAGSASYGDDGAALYKTKCAACHGADGKGETTIGKANKLRDLGSEDVQKLSDADLTAIVTSGKNKMPAYGKSLKPEQIKDLVAFVRTFKK